MPCGNPQAPEHDLMGDGGSLRRPPVLLSRLRKAVGLPRRGRNYQERSRFFLNINTDRFCAKKTMLHLALLAAAGLAFAGCGHGTAAAKPSPASSSSVVPPYQPTLPSSLKASTVHKIKITRALYETVADAATAKSAAYLQFDHFDQQTGQWKTVWSGSAPPSPKESLPPESYRTDLSSIVPLADGSTLVSSVFVSTGDASGSTADVFYMNPAQTSAVPVATAFGAQPSVRPIDKARAAILGASPGAGAVGWTGYAGFELSYSAKTHSVSKKPIADATTLLALEADGKPYVMVTLPSAGSGKLTFAAKNGASYRVSRTGSAPSLLVSSGAAVGFNLGLKPGIRLFSNAAAPGASPVENIASIVPSVLVPASLSGGKAFEVGIADVGGQSAGFLNRLTIAYAKGPVSAKASGA